MATPSTSPDRGVRLSYLRHFINEHGGEASFAGKTTAQVCFEFVVPLTKPSELSLVDHVASDPTTANYVAPANWYVSHAWMYLFLETVDSLERFFADRDLGDDAVLWFCVFNNNQHLASSYPFEYWSTTFKNGLAAIGNVVMVLHPWNDPIVLRRSWCVFEVYVAVTLGARFEIALAHDQEQRCIGDMAEDGAFRKMLATVKCENSEATVPSDRDGIFALIRAETSFIAVDQLIFSVFADWIKRTLEASIPALPSLLEQAERWSALGRIYQDERNYGDAARCHEHALLLRTSRADPLVVAMTQTHLGMMRSMLNQPASTWRPLFESALATQSDALGPFESDVFETQYYFVAALSRNGRTDEAKGIALDLFDAHRHVYGLAHKYTAVVMGLVASLHVHSHESRASLRWSRKAAALQEQLHGSDFLNTVLTLQIATVAYMNLGRFDEGLALNQRVLATTQRTFGADHELTLAATLNQGKFLVHVGELARATSILRSVRDLLPSAKVPKDYTRDVELNLGHAAWTSGDLGAAADHFQVAHRRVPGKCTVSAIYRLALATTDANARRDLLDLVVLDDIDEAPETWVAECVLCSKPVTGVLLTCKACPKGVLFFCAACAATKRGRLERFCRHDPPVAQLETALPPRRLLYHDALLAQEGSYERIESLLNDYATYCETYKVPMHERLQRRSVPVLNRNWHPMV
ncbi:hypothetical protein SDRG_11815 [Saprolegnia diclina VS20]|uniref:MalT-like TPR region domain-containing protein n=1 Tax=Saprolegnia diclina (strain VS20) TaxID=1156394 RepID=T0PY91_SAPDV|nr:hypothetical protein SDRG_11815 [Saprolegnia diclina VS20]EQC30499.1 hypothetical protein SDRG_11815 [Saprolegnia diclina VS20]|eukprot:XP_008616092.1 hypothetical protein SDRG_11815 [Saprolegnia diclina VS20]